MPTKIVMPQLGESVVEGTITKWLKQEGEPVSEMDALLEVNTDKVDTEIPSPASGTLLKILIPEGETVRAGTVIAWVGKPGENLPEGAAPGGAKAAAESQAPETADQGAEKPAQAIQESVETPAVVEQNAKAPAEPPAVVEQNAKAPAETHVVESTARAPSDTASTMDRNRRINALANEDEESKTAPTSGRSRELGFISPIVARLAQEHQLDLSRISGTGEGGRITKKDVLAYPEQNAGAKEQPAVAEAPAPWETPADGDLFRPTEMVFAQGKPQVAPQARPGDKTEPVKVTAAKSVPANVTQPVGPAPAMLLGEDELVPMSTMRRKIAEHMVVSKRTSPHVTTVMEADLHRVLAHYQANKPVFAREGAKLTYTAYFVAAAVRALRAFPVVNSSWADEGLLVHKRINIGLAVSLGEEGLIVPVLKNAGELSLLGLARAIGDLAGQARGHQLKPEDVRDGTFTVTNHGISGSLFATPVINQPQCAILGVGAVQKRVVVLEDEAGGDTIAIRPMTYLSLTFDHRILDGAAADGFLSQVVQTLETWA